MSKSMGPTKAYSLEPRSGLQGAQHTAGLPGNYKLRHGHTFSAEVRFQIRDQFWIPQPKLHWGCYLIFFENLKTEFLRFFVSVFYLVKKSGFQGVLGTV